MASHPNCLASVLDPRPVTRVGFGTPNTDDFVLFRRVFRSGENWSAPGWSVNPRIVVKSIVGGGVYRMMSGYAPDQLQLRVEVEDVAAGNALRALVGTTASLVLPDNPYAEDGTGLFVHTGIFRTQTGIFLAAADSEGITVRTRCERFSLTFERARVAPS